MTFTICCLGCTAETVGLDSDADGLSDAQELRFCTDQYNPDTDGDGILDSADDDPCKTPEIILTANISSIQQDYQIAIATIDLYVKNTLDQWLGDVSFLAHANAGELSSPQELGSGFYRMTLSANEDVDSIVTIETVGTDGLPDGRSSESILVELRLNTDQTKTPQPIVDPDPPIESHPELAEPGLNPGPYLNAGPMAGELWVMAIDGQTLDWDDDPLAPFAQAYVQVDLSDGQSLIGYTNAEGWIHFEDERLNSPVNITVGAKDSRYVTWMHADARVVSAGIHHRDILRREAETKGGQVSGCVMGFNGETGLDPFPTTNSNILRSLNVAIVQASIRNYPLSSMNSGSILLPPDGSNVSYIDIPPNFVVANTAHPEKSRFRLDRLIPGKYLIFALAGAGGNVTAALQNPYELKFEPYAFGMTEVEVKPGQKLDVDIPLTIDLRTQDNDHTSLYFGRLPNDPQTGQSLPMGLILPVINTGKGYVYVDVNATPNDPSFKNPVSLTFPRIIHETFQTLGLSLSPMVVGLAARKAVSGFDLPGISTMIIHPQKDETGNFSNIYMNNADKWPTLPRLVTPAPSPTYLTDMDSVGGSLNPTREITWTSPDGSDLTVLRFNYMTPPVHNSLLGTDIGSSQAHPLWEVFVPGDIHSIHLPTLNASAPDYPVLINHEPTSPTDPYTYAENTIEIEINAYFMGPKSFHYNSDFLISDTNMASWGCSQDSFLIDTK